MLDTSVVIPLRDGDPAIASRVANLAGTPVIAMLTRIELENGVYRDPTQAVARRNLLDAMLPTFHTVPFDERAAQAYGAIVERLGYSRRLMIDRMIAAQAVVHGATLATRNPSDFAGIPGLALEHW